MDVLNEVCKIAKEKSQKDSKAWKVILIVGTTTLCIWGIVKFLGWMKPRVDDRRVRNLYIPKYPSRRY